MSVITALRKNIVLQIPATLLTLVLMWGLPILFHASPGPEGLPIGARLLPIYYAPLLAAALFNPIVPLASSLVMPFINHSLTGMPTLNIAVLLSVELTVFSLVLIFTRSRGMKQPAIAPLAVLIGKAVSACLLFVIPLVPSSPVEYFSSSVITALPGILIILVIQIALSYLPMGTQGSERE